MHSGQFIQKKLAMIRKKILTAVIWILVLPMWISMCIEGAFFLQLGYHLMTKDQFFFVTEQHKHEKDGYIFFKPETFWSHCMPRSIQLCFRRNSKVNRKVNGYVNKEFTKYISLCTYSWQTFLLNEFYHLSTYKDLFVCSVAWSDNICQVR